MANKFRKRFFNIGSFVNPAFIPFREDIGRKISGLFRTPKTPGAEQFAIENPERFNLDPSKFIVQEPSFLTDLSEIDRPLVESEQQTLSGLVPEENEARRRLINQVAGTGRFGSPISSYDFAPLEQSILGNRAGIRGSFAEKRAQARERARQQLLALRQANVATQREIEQGNIGLQAGLAQKKSDTDLQLALARIMAKIQNRRDIASLIGGGIGSGLDLFKYLS